MRPTRYTPKRNPLASAVAAIVSAGIILSATLVAEPAHARTSNGAATADVDAADAPAARPAPPRQPKPAPRPAHRRYPLA